MKMIPLFVVVVGCISVVLFIGPLFASYINVIKSGNVYEIISCTLVNVLVIGCCLLAGSFLYKVNKELEKLKKK